MRVGQGLEGANPCYVLLHLSGKNALGLKPAEGENVPFGDKTHTALSVDFGIETNVLPTRPHQECVAWLEG